MNVFPAALGLSPGQVEHAIRLAGAAPSLHNSQPWLFRVAPDVIELYADVERRMVFTDPGDAELRLGCGAALFNLRLALEHCGVRPSVALAPHARTPALLAEIRSGGQAGRASEHTTLFHVITARRTNRRPFLPAPVPMAHRDALALSVQAEHNWLHIVDRTQRASLIGLLRRAHQMQMADEGFRAEMAKWTGRRQGAREGVPASSAGPRPEDQDEWVLRDFSGGRARPRVPGKDFEDDPLTVVLCSYSKSRVADLQAGQALQRLLLTATSLGLSVSFLSQVVEVRETKEELQGLLGGTLQPQAVLRIGYGSPVPATPRRAPEELLINDDWTELELGPQPTGAAKRPAPH